MDIVEHQLNYKTLAPFLLRLSNYQFFITFDNKKY
jgi:hypothetical protein